MGRPKQLHTYAILWVLDFEICTLKKTFPVDLGNRIEDDSKILYIGIQYINSRSHLNKGWYTLIFQNLILSIVRSHNYFFDF